jgi:hypothetical protein
MVNPKRFYTYAYLREDRTPYYIGKGEGRRLYKKSKGEVGKPKDKSRIIFLKQNLTEQKAFKHEIYMIAVFGRKDLGTGILRNKTNGGDGGSGLVISEYHRKCIIKANKGRKVSDETRKKLRESQIGRKLSEKTKSKIGKIHRGKKLSEETKNKISNALKGREVSDEFKNNLKKRMIGNKNMLGKIHSEKTKKIMSEKASGKNNHFYGKTHTKETKDKLSRNNIGRKWWNNGQENKFVVECPGKEWSSGRFKKNNYA